MMNVFAAKGSWRANAATNLELSIFGDPAIHHVVEGGGPHTPLTADPYRKRFEAGNMVGVLRGTAQLSRFLVEASAARSTGKSNWTGDTDAAQGQPLFMDNAARTISGGIGIWSKTGLARSSFVVKATMALGRHTTVIGTEYEDVSVSRDFGWTGGYLLQTVGSGGFRTQTDNASGTFHNRVPTAYLQNGWRVTDAVTINAGLRWSAQTLTAASGRTAQRFPNEWQPRLGVIWQPSASRKDRLYASFGRFHLQLPLNLATLWYVDYASKWTFYSTDPRKPGAVADSVWNLGGRETDTPMNIPGLDVESADEISFGYERLVGKSLKLTSRAVRRDLRSSFQWGFDSNWKPYLGTPGKAGFAFLPKPVRQYRALEVGAEGRWHDIAYRASYLLSRSRGNFSGLFNSDQGFANPGAPGYFMLPAHAVNSTGLLPNDHTHLFKLSGSGRMRFGLTAGAFITAQSGSPVSAIGFTPEGIPMFAEPRGSAGRTPWLWDANFRFVKELRFAARNRGRVVLDVLHAGNPQRPVRLIEEKYQPQTSNGMPVLDPNYRQPLSYQAPMMVRLGIETGF
jgi:hypothetical protein